MTRQIKTRIRTQIPIRIEIRVDREITEEDRNKVTGQILKVPKDKARRHKTGRQEIINREKAEDLLKKDSISANDYNG